MRRAVQCAGGLALSAVMLGCSAVLPADDSVRLRSLAVTPSTQRTPLLYVTNARGAGVSVYDYDNGDRPRLIRTLQGIAAPEGECVDHLGDVFITSLSSSQVYEFAYGATHPKKIISDDYGYPASCAIDPKSGSLAVANEGGFNSSPANVVIYPAQGGKPKVYYPSNLANANFCGYDAVGNLYVDGSNEVTGFAFALAELTYGSRSFAAIAVSGTTIYYPGAVQWLGPTLLVGDSSYRRKDTTAIYELRIEGQTATVVRTIPLQGSGQVLQFVKRENKVIAAQPFHHRTIYDFQTGAPVGEISRGLSSAFGVAISE